MARLVLESGPEKGKEIKLPDAGEIVFGRDTSCGYQILDLAASRNHFKILGENGLWTLLDLNSRNGTNHNGDKIERADLTHGDLIRVGEAVFKFDEQGAGLAPPAPPKPENPEPVPITDFKYKDPLVGRVVGGYKLLEQIGRGGMGTVYIANQLSLNRDVALKILSPKYTSDEKFVEMFVKEARAAGALNHPNIVQVYDVGRDGDMHFFSMEYMAKGSVGDLLKQLGKLSVPRALAMTIHAAKGLEYAEKRGLIHCDIKPDNLMLNDDGTVKIVDLGLSRTTMGEKSSEESDVVFGTPNFVSPEQAQRKKIDHRVDQYSLGAAFFNMITGKPPFSGESARDIVRKHINEPPPQAKDVDPAIPEAVSRIIDRMLKKNPEERYPNSTALLEDLRTANIAINPQAAYTDGFPGMAYEEKPRATGFIALAVGAAAALLLAVILIPLLLGGNGGENPGNGGEPVVDPQGGGQNPGGATDPPEKTPPPVDPDNPSGANPGDPEDDKFDEQCQLAAEYLKDTRELQKRNGDFDPIVIENFKALSKKFPGTPAAKEAEETAAELEKQLATHLKLEEAASKLLKDLERTAKAALEQDRYGDALKAYDSFPLKEYEDTEAAGEVSKARLFIEERLKDAWTVGKTKALGLERQGDFEGAKKFFNQVVELWRVEAFSEMAREEVSRIDRTVASRHEAAAAATLQAEKAAFGKAELEALGLAKTYAFSAAAERVGSLLSASNPGGALTLKEFSEKAARMKSDFDNLAALKKKMIQEANDKSGEVRIMLPSNAPGGGREAIVIKADDSEVGVKLGAADTKFTWQSFGPPDFLEAALKLLSPDILPLDRLRLGLFALILGVPDKVEQQLSAAARDETLRGEAEKALKRFQSGAGIAGQQVEARAENEFRRITELFLKAEAEPDHEEAFKLLRQAQEAFDAWREEYGHTQFARNR